MNQLDMRYLIDTNVFIRLIKDYDISDDIKDILEDYNHVVYVSSESIKEFVHLTQNNKIVQRKEIRSLDIFDLIENTLGLNIKYVTKEHLRSFSKLASVEGHNNPVNRLPVTGYRSPNFNFLDCFAASVSQ
jgi:PIN domain nuclease of toxin-antitoxin system